MRALRSNAPVRIRVRLPSTSAIASLTVGFLIRDRLGNDVFGTNTHHLESLTDSLIPGKRYRCEFDIAACRLGQGHYSIAVALHESDSHLVRNHDWWDQALVFEVLRDDEPYRIGVANLPIECSGIREIERADPWQP